MRSSAWGSCSFLLSFFTGLFTNVAWNTSLLKPSSTTRKSRKCKWCDNDQIWQEGSLELSLSLSCYLPPNNVSFFSFFLFSFSSEWSFAPARNLKQTRSFWQIFTIGWLICLFMSVILKTFIVDFFHGIGLSYEQGKMTWRNSKIRNAKFSCSVTSFILL